MCGIAGLCRMGQDAAPIAVWAVEQLLLDCEKRGIDSSGVALQTYKGEVFVVKGALPAWQFLKSKSWERFAEEHSDGVLFRPEIRVALCHARAQSVGGAWRNENNHPVTAGKTAVTHNGGIRNHDYLFKDLKLERKAEVDSDVIRAILDKEGLTQSGLKLLNRMTGPAAIAAVSTEYPGRLLIARSGSPLTIAAMKDSKHMVWASRKDAIHKINRQWEKWWGLEMQSNRADLVFNPVPHEFAFIWQGDQLIHREMFTSNNGAKHELTYTCHSNHAEKVKDNRLKEAEAKMALVKVGDIKPLKPNPDLMECPGKCGLTIRITDEFANSPLESLACPRCGTSLSGGQA